MKIILEDYSKHRKRGNKKIQINIYDQRKENKFKGG